MQYKKTIPRPLIVEKFLEFFSAIDVHDHYRQCSLAIEREWITHTWWHRTFGTIFGICVVDAYLAYRYESDKDFLASTEVVDFATFMDLLAHQLMMTTTSMYHPVHHYKGAVMRVHLSLWHM